MNAVFWPATNNLIINYIHRIWISKGCLIITETSTEQKEPNSYHGSTSHSHETGPMIMTVHWSEFIKPLSSVSSDEAEHNLHIQTGHLKATLSQNLPKLDHTHSPNL